jgi:hypothetical protein
VIQYQGKTILIFINGYLLNLQPQALISPLKTVPLSLIWGISRISPLIGRDNE